jgi:cyclopropane fatty-acyl-phospholipid synthase-like methyltransferase
LETENYWEKYWNFNEMILRDGIHQKIGRTINGIPISNEDWESVLNDLTQHLQLKKDDVVLDIASGSGAIALPFSEKVKSITAIDISKKLLDSIESRDNLIKINADIRNYEFEENSFSKIIFYFAVQHFTEQETVCLFSKIHKWLKPSGICFIGDIPDIDRKFNFFNSSDREKIYFQAIASGNPIIGTWFKKDFLLKLSNWSGFKCSKIIYQPTQYINSHYRFDLKILK